MFLMEIVGPEGKLKFLCVVGGGRGRAWSLLIYSSVTDLLCELGQVTCSPMLGLIYKIGIIKVEMEI